jgi:hypothetical protein
MGELASFTGLELERDASTGRVTIVKGSKRSSKGTSTWFANRLKQIIDDTRREVSIETKRSQPGVFLDAYDYNRLDVDDYDAFKKADPKFAAAALAHVVNEYYFEQTIPVGFGREPGIEYAAVEPSGPASRMGKFLPSHLDSTQFESNVLSDFTGWWEKQRPDKPVVTLSTGNVHTFEYSTVLYDVVVKNNAVISVTKYENRKPRKY